MTKKILSAVVLTLLAAALTALCGCQLSSGKKYGTLTLNDVQIAYGETYELQPEFSEQAEELTYTFDGDAISIEDGVITALVAETTTEVTAKSKHFSVKFTVTVGKDYGTLTLNDVSVTFAGEVLLYPVFSDEEYESDVTYAFEGNDIAIEDGKVKGLVPDTVTTVTATTEYHKTTFDVTVTNLNAVLTNPDGAESKFAVPTPDDDTYIVTATVEVSEYRPWSRLCAWAFNASDNSWYNIEMFGDGHIHLFAHFNGVEKYWIHLFHKDAVTDENGNIVFDVALLKQGQATRFYVNGNLVCFFTESEMNGYDGLGALEVTACANRDDGGEYKTELKNVFYAEGDSELYESFTNNVSFADTTFVSEDGAEQWYRFGDVSAVMGDDYLFSTTVEINEYDAGYTRTSSFAFNSWDNCWYNIEMNDQGAFHLFGRFNGIEKYWIYLFNKNDEGVTVDGKIRYTVDILKKGMATWCFVNGKLACAYSEAEMAGFADYHGWNDLRTLEISFATDTGWRDGTGYSITFSDVSAKSASGDEYAAALAATEYKNEETVLSSENGAETKYVLGNLYNLYNNFVLETTVNVEKYRENGWTRLSAFAFNASDNSWYNIEMNEGGDVILYARFNGVEKYGIKLFNINDEGVLNEGTFAFSAALLKKGQETFFYINGKLVCNFTESEMNGYATLGTLEITACANREWANAGEYVVKFLNTTIYSADSETYGEYLSELE